MTPKNLNFVQNSESFLDHLFLKIVLKSWIYKWLFPDSKKNPTPRTYPTDKKGVGCWPCKDRPMFLTLILRTLGLGFKEITISEYLSMLWHECNASEWHTPHHNEHTHLVYVTCSLPNSEVWIQSELVDWSRSMRACSLRLEKKVRLCEVSSREVHFFCK